MRDWDIDRQEFRRLGTAFFSLLSPGNYYIDLITVVFIFCVLLFCLQVCLCTVHVPGVHIGQKTASDCLELELPMIVEPRGCSLN